MLDAATRISPSRAPIATESPLPSGTQGFISSLGQVLDETNQMQLRSSAMAESTVRGGGPPIEQVMVNSQEASLAFQATLAFRNKAIDAYQEVMRMQF